MEQTFQYPNLLTGTRSGEGWKLIGGKAVMANQSYYEYGPVLPCYNSAATETWMWSSPVVLHKNTDYTLHCFAANTRNMSSTDIYVLDVDGRSDSYQWLGAHLTPRTPGPGGGVARLDVPPRCQRAGRRALPAPLRQQRLHGRRERAHLVPRHHAHQEPGAARMGTGRRGGVA